MKLLLVTLLSLSCSTSFADQLVLNSGESVSCSGPDNFYLVLNAGRTKIKTIIENESQGFLTVMKKQETPNGLTTFTTAEGTLALSEHGNTWLPVGQSEGDFYTLNCK